MTPHSEHHLLLHHFATWAEKRNRTVDLDLVEEIVHLRSAYDELEATFWPPGSVEHLLLERWPSKGAVEPPEPDVLVASLGGFLRFLRNTGRMSSRSAAPADLEREIRRAAPRMAEVATDRVNWSPGKVLADFGRSIGIDMEQAADLDDAQELLDEVQNRWNLLPVEERRRLMPHADDAPLAAAEDLSGAEVAMSEWDVEDRLTALLLTFRERLPRGELPGADVVAPLVRAAPYTRAVLALVDWVGEGKELTDTAVLRPALARQASADLGLGGWLRDQLERDYPDERLPGVAAIGREAWIQREIDRPWRSAADHEELHRLWMGATGSGLVQLRGKKGIAAGRREDDPEWWVSIGVRSVLGMMRSHLDRTFRIEPVLWGLMESYVDGCRAVAKADILDFTLGWLIRPSHHGEGIDWREHYEPSVDSSIGQLADTGIFVETRDSIALTPYGDVVLTAFLGYLQDD